MTEQQTRLDNLRAEIVNTREEHALQEIGIFEYRHRLSDAVAYRGAIEKLQGEIKAMARRDGGAIESLAPWVVNESVTDGRKMVREYSTLMLRAHNAEVDNLIRNLKPHKSGQRAEPSQQDQYGFREARQDDEAPRSARLPPASLP
ncbi:hypothetical protein [Nocardia sp. NPDC058705]|uniref:hypothetical protein n=1 Tax=Nocardia sp. NPDC058705 TaxID=3346609 RepID=UPI0036CAFACE